MDWKTPRIPTSDDQLFVYMIVNKVLEMSSGKIGAQCGHAIQLLLLEQNRIARLVEKTDSENNILLRMEYWCTRYINGGFNKIVLGANPKEWAYIKDNYNPIIVTDAGRTEVEPGSETVMALWPLFKDERCNILSRMRLLK